MAITAAMNPPLIEPLDDYALFLDLDGTLLEIAERPESVCVEDSVKTLIALLHDKFDGAVALITGRSIAGIDALLSPLRVPVAGQHGLERRDGNGKIYEDRTRPRWLDRARIDLTRWAMQHPGVQIEDKGLSIAVHYRQVPTLGNELDAFLRGWLAGHRSGLQVQLGKMVAELKPSGRDKGIAIGDFLREPPFKGRRPVFIGDDFTDEYGFTFVNGHDGISVKVGLGDTVAQYNLENVTAVHRWLKQLVGSKKGLA